MKKILLSLLALFFIILLGIAKTNSWKIMTSAVAGDIGKIEAPAAVKKRAQPTAALGYVKASPTNSVYPFGTSEGACLRVNLTIPVYSSSDVMANEIILYANPERTVLFNAAYRVHGFSSTYGGSPTHSFSTGDNGRVYGFTSCQPVPINNTPTVDAGEEVTLKSPANAIIISGAGTDPDGQITSYNWTKVSGPDGVIIKTPGSAWTPLTNLQQGTYIFRLEVRDNRDAAAQDEVTVNVLPPSGTNSPTGEGTHLPRSFTSASGTSINFYEFKPYGYGNDPAKRYPLIIFLHGNGVKGSDLNYILSEGLPMEIQKTKRMTFTDPTTGLNESFLVLSPQLPASKGAWESQYVDELIKYAKTSLLVDESRIYLTGLSLGGGGAIAYASSSKGSDIAAIAPVATICTWEDLQYFKQFSINTWTFMNAGDGTPSGGAECANILTDRINKLSPGLAILTMYPVAGHNAWDNAYNPTAQIHIPNMYEWFLSHRRLSTNNPTANAGPDQTITTPASSVTLDGGTSTPPTSGSITGFTWSYVSGPAGAIIQSPTASSTVVSGLIVGTYVFNLEVTSNSGTTSTDRVTVKVLAEPTAPSCAAMSFDGNDFIDINDITIDGDFTFETWIKLEERGSEKFVVIGQGSGLGQHINFYQEKLTFYRPNQNLYWQPIQAKIQHPIGEWKHYAVVRKDGLLSIYINGSHDTTSPITMSEAFIPKVIGKDFSSFKGKLDEMRIWSTARTAAQIADNYNKSIAGNTTGLVAYYKFNEAAADQQVIDASPNNNDGRRGYDPGADTSDPTRVYTELPAIAGDCEAPPTCAAMSFDGNDFIDINDITIDGDFTFETWIKLEERGSEKFVVIGQGSGLGQHINFYQEKLTFYRPNQNLYWQPIQAKIQHPIGEWKHYAVVRKDGLLSIYINGSHDTTSPITMSEAFIPKVIGKDFSSFKGKLDEMRIWGTARTAQQIADNYNKSIAGNTTGLVAYYKFNEAAGDQQVIDASPNNNDGRRGYDPGTDTSDPTRVYTQLPPISGECGTLSVSRLGNDLKETADEISLKIFPNPVLDQANIKVDALSSGMYEIRISDVNGKLIYNNKIFIRGGSGQTIRINLPATGNGFFIVQVKGNNQLKSEKIIRLR